MRKIAKILSLVLALATLATLCTFSASAANFKDVSAKDEALYEAVQLLNSLGIAKGTSDTTYGANKSVTREQMAAFIYRLMKEGKSQEGGDNITTFTDLKDPTFYYMISWANQQGIIKGRSETIFDPSGKISLQDCYVMITRALGYEKDGALVYPYGYIDVAERIGLSENLDEDIEYTDDLTRGQVAIILYNAFYAEMNYTYSKTIVLPFEKPGEQVAQQYVTEEVQDTVCRRIYGIEEITRRVVATPSYAIDLSTLSGNVDYKAYKPTGSELMDEVFVETAAIVPGVDATRVDGEESMIKFEDLGLSGEADDYFLHDINIYIKKDGTILAASASGETVTGATASAQTRDGEDKGRDFYYSKSVKNSDGSDGSATNISNDGKKIRTGAILLGADKAYFYNKPDSVDNYSVSIAPVESDEDGRIIFKANVIWSGSAAPTFTVYEGSYTQNPYAYMDDQRAKHNDLTKILSVANTSGGKHSVQYYDSNNDGVVDYMWMQPMTFGKIVDKSGDSNTLKAKHTGNSQFRAVFNSSKNVPEIYVGEANIEGGSYTNGQYVFAYVAAPANYIRIAADDVNGGIRTMTSKVVWLNSDHNGSRYEDGTTIYAWNSGNQIVGHINSNGTGLVDLSQDESNSEAFATNWRSQLAIGDTWEIVTAGGRAYLGKKVATTVNVAKQHAVVQFVNEDENQVVFDAGGIEFDGTLVAEKYVQAYINGSIQLVKSAEKNENSDSGIQDDNYFVDKGLVNNISTYTVNSDGAYTFNPIELDANAANLTDEEDATLTYTVETTGVSLQKVQNNLYKFVPGASLVALPGILAPNNMKYVEIGEDTKILLNYIDSEGYSDYKVYDYNNMPNFAADDESMEFSKAVIVLENKPTSTTTEKLAFLYCEIGGEIVDDTTEDANYAILLGNTEELDSNNKVIFTYDVVDPKTAETRTSVQTTKTTSSALPKYELYKLDTDDSIRNTSGGRVASLALGSADLHTLDSFEEDAGLLFLNGVEAMLVDENTVYALLDRETDTVTIEDASMLTVTAEEDADDVYYNEDADKMTAYVVAEKRSGEDFKYATLVIVARG